MYSTGCPSSSGSYSVLVPWSGGVSWGLLRRIPPRSLLSHPGHQRSQFTPLIGTRVTLSSFCSYLHNPGPSFSVVGPSVWNGLPLAQRLRPRILSDTFYCLASKLFFLVVHGSGALLSSNLEEALYKSP